GGRAAFRPAGALRAGPRRQKIRAQGGHRAGLPVPGPSHAEGDDDAAIGAISRQKGLPWYRGDLDQRHAARSDAAPSPRAATPFGVDRATIARWQAFWRDYVPHTTFWKVARARLVPVVDLVALPLSLVEAFHEWRSLSVRGKCVASARDFFDF